jgi:type II secretory pathway component PulM
MGTDMTMIEKVARAICKTHGAFDPDALTAGVAAWKYYIPEARAAIAAMREPTDEIRRAGDQTISPEAYQAMIDAALNENVEQA